jgi:hypothetical protein
MFQTRQGLCVSGVVSGQTKQAIFRAVSRLASPQAAEPLPDAIVRVVQAQLPRWQGPGGTWLRETEPAATPILQEYYRDGVCELPSAAQLQSATWHSANYWSAVFVSWVMRSAGAGITFRYHTAHRVYIRAARRNRLDGNAASPFWAYRATEVAPLPGDVVCRSRGGPPVATYDNIAQNQQWAAHCDIVISSPQSGQILVAGGNVAIPGGNPNEGRTAAQRPLRVRPDGLLQLDGNQARYFAVIRCRGRAPGL